MLLPQLRPDQKTLYNEIGKHQNVVCIFPRGTGKTTTAMTYALDMFMYKQKTTGVYICNKKHAYNGVSEELTDNILVNPLNIDSMPNMGGFGTRFINRERNILDILMMDKFVHAASCEFMILDELDVITEQTQLETFKALNNFQTQQRIIFTSLAYKSFMDNLTNRYFGSYKVIKL